MSYDSPTLDDLFGPGASDAAAGEPCEFFILYPNDDRSAPFSSYADAFNEAKAAVKRVGRVTIFWMMDDGGIGCHVVDPA